MKILVLKDYLQESRPGKVKRRLKGGFMGEFLVNKLFDFVMADIIQRINNKYYCCAYSSSMKSKVLRRISWVALMDNHKTIPERYDQMLIKEVYK